MRVWWHVYTDGDDAYVHESVNTQYHLRGEVHREDPGPRTVFGPMPKDKTDALIAERRAIYDSQLDHLKSTKGLVTGS